MEFVSLFSKVGSKLINSHRNMCIIFKKLTVSINGLCSPIEEEMKIVIPWQAKRCIQLFLT